MSKSLKRVRAALEAAGDMVEILEIAEGTPRHIFALPPNRVQTLSAAKVSDFTS